MADLLTAEQFQTLLKGLKANYPQDWFIPNEEAARLWYRMLMDIPYEALSLGITKYMQTKKELPTISDIRQAAIEFMPKEKELGEQEAWALVRKAVSNSSYHADEEFEQLPDVLKAAVGSPQNLTEWATMDIDTFETVQQSQFLRAFRVAKVRRQEVNLLSPAIQKRLAEFSDKLSDSEKLLKGGNDDST